MSRSSKVSCICTRSIGPTSTSRRDSSPTFNTDRYKRTCPPPRSAENRIFVCISPPPSPESLISKSIKPPRLLGQSTEPAGWDASGHDNDFILSLSKPAHWCVINIWNTSVGKDSSLLSSVYILYLPFPLPTPRCSAQYLFHRNS